jgi:serine phosphatase RsbU (regulator of sigma subunit)
MIEAPKVSTDEHPLDRSRSFLAVAERDRLERVLHLLAVALPGGEPDRIAGALAEAACLLANARVAWVLLPETVPFTIAAGPDGGWVDVTAQARWPMVTSALEGTPVHVPDVLDRKVAWSIGVTGASGSGSARTVDGRPLRSLSALPISGQGAVRGALVLAHHRAHAFSERQLELVGWVADHLGHALEMCEAVTEQRRVATALQQTLLPPVLPCVDGIELAARYRPSGSGNLVGGDFYDVFSDGLGGWYVLIGDASGIGPEAAGLAGVARYTARALAETAAEPSEMLGHLNRALLRAAPADRFCTAVIARLRALVEGSVTVTLASGGHPPPLVQRREGMVEPAIATTGLILGIVPEAPIGRASIVLEAGDAITFYTDGVVEAHAVDGDQFGEERLVEVLAGARGRSAAGTARRVERAVADFRSPDDHDDLAIVVARCCPPPEEGLARGPQGRS